MAALTDVDRLLLSQLRSPMLTELMVSMQMKAEMDGVAEEIKRRWLAKVPKETGNLASTARVTSHRSTVMRDKRWESEFSFGGPRAPYAPEVEARDHALAQVLREMGYFVGDIRMVAKPRDVRPPTPAKSAEEHRAEQKASPLPHSTNVFDEATLVRSKESQSLLDQADALNRPGRRIGSKARDADYAALRSAVAAFDQGLPGAQEATQVASSALAQYRLLREARGLTGEPG